MSSYGKLYVAALAADNAFSAAVASVTGGKRDRWTMTNAEALLPIVADAYHAKLAADRALREASSDWSTFARPSRVNS